MKDLTQFIREIASAYDFPELLAAEGIVDGLNTTFEAKATARGQWAIIVKTVAIRVVISSVEMARGILSASVILSYQHQGSGRNGCTEYYLLCFDHSYGGLQEEEYQGSVRQNVFSRVQTRFGNVQEDSRREIDSLVWEMFFRWSTIQGVTLTADSKSRCSMVMSSFHLRGFKFSFELNQLQSLRVAVAILTMWSKRGLTLMTESGVSLKDIPLTAEDAHTLIS